MKSVLISILLTGLLFSQSTSEKRAVDEKVFDLSHKMKQQSQALKTGEAEGGIKLSEEQLIEIAQAREYNRQQILELLGAGVGVPEIDPMVFEYLEFFLDPDNKTHLYYRYRTDSLAKLWYMYNSLKQ